MTFRSLAISNVKGNWRAYSAYFFSSAFSVAIFYLYAAFIYHPAVANGRIVGAQGVKTVMEICLYLIIIFSFFFVLYSNSSFLKTRKKEFGLFSLFGMTRGQLRKMVIYENLVISVMAIVTGIGIGMLFSKLFFMALSAILQLEQAIPFASPMKAIMLTAIGFFTLFFCLSLWSSFRIGKVQIIDLLKSGQQPKGELVYSKWLAFLAVISLGASYSMALVMDAFSFVLLSLPIIITAVIGTYFLLTQLSVFIIHMAKKNKSFYYKRTNLLTFAQLGYKIRDNARILFTVSILSAVIMTAMGTVYIFQLQTKDDVLSMYPHTIAFSAEADQLAAFVDEANIEQTIEANHFTITVKDKLTGILLPESVLDIDISTKQNSTKNLNWDGITPYIVSVSDYNKMAQHQKLPAITLHEQELIFIGSQKMYIGMKFKAGVLKTNLVEDQAQYKIVDWLDDQLLNRWMNNIGQTLVASDALFAKLMEAASAEQKVSYVGYELADWTKAGKLIDSIKGDLTEEQLNAASFGRVEQFNEVNATSGLTLFIGLFISLLFFLAAGSMIYFKLFTELAEDQMIFRSLNRIGVTKEEIRKIAISQIAIIFFVPCVVGIVHALFAMQSLDNLLQASNWQYSFVVIGIFVAMQFIYFLIASRSYMKSLVITNN